MWARGDARAVDHLIQMKNNRTNLLVDHISESHEDRRGSSKHSAGDVEQFEGEARGKGSLSIVISDESRPPHKKGKCGPGRPQ